MSVTGAVESPWGYPQFIVPMTDARPMQDEAPSEAEFFAEHGFVLLKHATEVRDWDANAAAPEESDLGRFYMAEIEEIIRSRLLPGHSLLVFQRPVVLRRGAGTPNPFYGLGVHQDFGLDPDDYQVNVHSFAGDVASDNWRKRWETEDVIGFMTINFWRTTNMKAPLRHMPLGLCDPTSVKFDDVIPTRFNDIAPEGRPTNQLALRHDPAQRWYYYPDMDSDELIAFKIFECSKDGNAQTLKTCFHSAFEDPSTPKDAEMRQSCEHRVGVFIMKS